MRRGVYITLSSIILCSLTIIWFKTTPSQTNQPTPVEAATVNKQAPKTEAIAEEASPMAVAHLEIPKKRIAFEDTRSADSDSRLETSNDTEESSATINGEISAGDDPTAHGLENVSEITKRWHTRSNNDYVPFIPEFDLRDSLVTLDESVNGPFDEIYNAGIDGSDSIASFRLLAKCNNYRAYLTHQLKVEFGTEFITLADIDLATWLKAKTVYEACLFIAIQTCRTHMEHCSDSVLLSTLFSLYFHPDQRVTYYAWQLVGLTTGIAKELSVYSTDKSEYGENITQVPQDIRAESDRRAQVIIETILAEEWDFEVFKHEYWGDAVFLHPEEIDDVDEIKE